MRLLSYAKDLPIIRIDETSTKTTKVDLVKEFRQAARQSIMQEVDENLFLVDYGLVTKKIVLKSNVPAPEGQTVTSAKPLVFVVK